MDAPPNCPLDPHTAYTFRRSAPPLGLSHLHLIENHVSTNDCVNCPHPPLKEFIFDGRLKGTTPLLLACHYGEFDSVKRIVESWGVDVRTAATYYPEPSRAEMGLMMKIESATPLFVAAFQWHSKIVRYLLEKGADVAAKTSNEAKPEYDGLTPLDGAVSEHCTLPYRQPLNKQHAERNAIILSLLEFGADLSASFKPSWSNRWCGVDTTMTLIKHGMDLNKRDPSSGRTVLHYWASVPRDFTEEVSLTMVKLLIERGADIMARDNYGVTPIITAVTGNRRVCRDLYLNLLDFLLERDDIAIMEKIEAMELAGANILFFRSNSSLFPKAFEYWRRATHLRQVEESGSYQKKLAQKSIGTIEWTTSDQVEHLQHPTENNIKIQSILVQLRILSSKSWTAVNHFLLVYMFAKSIDEFECIQNLEFLDIYWAMSDTILLFQPSERELRNWSVRVVSSLIDTLLNLKESNPTLLNSEIIKKSFHLILATDRLRLTDRERETQTKTSSSRTMFWFLEMLLGLPEMLDDLWGSLPQLLHHLGSNEVGSLLLPACKDYKNAHYFAIIRLLFQLGANVDTADKDGNRPLHLEAQSDRKQSEAAGCLLLGYGAHLHRTNNSGKTAVDLWIERNEKDQKGEEEAADSRDRPDWCRKVPKMLCLSARCIRAHDVPYEDEPEFFQDSHSFIEKH